MMQELNYIRCGDYYIPDIRLPEKNRPIGRWGRLHRDYIKEHKRHTYFAISMKKYDLRKTEVLFRDLSVQYREIDVNLDR